MSVQAITWAYAVEDLDDPIEAFILVTLANHADEYGVLWIKQATLAARCRCSKRSVIRRLQLLEQRGLVRQLHRRRANGSQQSSAFLLVGFEDRRRPRTPDEHPVLEEQYLAGLLDAATIGVTACHPAAGCPPDTARVTDGHYPGDCQSPLEPSSYTTPETYPPYPPSGADRSQQGVCNEREPVRRQRSAHGGKPAASIWERAGDEAVARVDAKDAERARARSDPGSGACRHGGDRTRAVRLVVNRDDE